MHNTRNGVLGREASNIGEQTIAADTAVPATRANSIMRVGAGIKFVLTMRVIVEYFATQSTLHYRSRQQPRIPLDLREVW